MLTRPRPRWRRLGLNFLGILLLLLASSFLSWQYLKQHWQIHSLSLHGIDLGWNRLHIDSAQLRLGAEQPMAIDIQQLSLNWQRFSLTELTIEHLQLQQAAAAAPSPAPPFRFNGLAPEQYLSSLPQRIEIQRLNAQLPCATGLCDLNGSLSFDQTTHQLQAQLDHPEHNLTLLGQLQGEHISLSLSNQGNTFAQLQSHWQTRDAAQDWSGQLQIDMGPEQQPLLIWLEEWLGPFTQDVQLLAQAQLNSHWQLSLALGEVGIAELLEATGQIDVNGQLQGPWPIPSLGPVQGHILLALKSQNGQWHAEQIEGLLLLSKLAPRWQALLPKALDFGQIELSFNAATLVQKQTAQPISLQLTSQGPSQLSASTRLLLDTDPEQWQVKIEQLDAHLSMPTLQSQGIELKRLNVQLNAQGEISAAQQALRLLAGSNFTLEQFDWPEQQLQIKQLQGKLANLELQHSQTAEFTVHGPLLLSASTLQQPLLKTQNWKLEGPLSIQAGALSFAGSLSNAHGYPLPMQLSLSPAQALQLKLGPSTWSFARHNPFSQIFADWPSSLEFSHGTADLNANLSWKNTELSGALNLRLNQVDGIYENSELTQLSANLNATLAKQQLQARLNELSLQQLNPGIPLENIALQGHFSAPLTELGSATISWQTARAELFAGRLWLDAGQLKIGQINPPHQLHLVGLDLERLLQTYPTEGLMGAGLIDGQLPLLLSSTGASIQAGNVQASAPGRLSFSNSKLAALEQNNPAMAVVVQALRNFHYSTLESGVTYTEQGKLLLSLKLHGESPEVENGRAINLNINLEEDIPSLLKSLQLSGKVSDKIQQRVQQRTQVPAAGGP